MTHIAHELKFEAPQFLVGHKLQIVHVHGFFIFSRWGSKTLQGLVEFNDRMSEIKLPVLICHGDDDRVCHIDGARKLYDTASSEDKTLKVFC